MLFRSAAAAARIPTDTPAQADPGPQAVAPAGDAVRASGGPIEDVSSIAAATLPAVVSIVAEGGTQEGSGSGFIIREDGYLLTNNHVVDLVSGGGTLTVVFNDGGRAEGTVVGTSPSYDLAVVKVPRTGLPTVSLGDSSAVHVGDLAIAIGAPLGLDGTVTSGIVSALDRPVTAGDQADVSYINAIQTDAAINPGNSGGPLLNSRGEVVGINTAIANPSEAQNVGFAIAIDSARPIIDQLRDGSDVKLAYLGVQTRTVTPATAKDDNLTTQTGAIVIKVEPGTAAADAGLERGDVIVAVDGTQVRRADDVGSAIRGHRPGDSVRLTIERAGERRSITVTLGSVPLSQLG